MPREFIQNLKKIMKAEAFDDFMQNIAAYCSLEEVRSLGLDDKEIKKLRKKQYNANVAKVGQKWFDEDDDEDDGDWEYQNNDGHIKIFIEGPIDSWFGVDAPAIVRKLRDEKEIRSIHLDIASPGGFVSEALTLYHELKAQQRKGIPITTESRGVVASAACDLFVTGGTRIATQHSMFMIHAPWAFIFMVGNKWEMKRKFKAMMTSFDVFTQNAIDIIADNIDGLEKKTVEGWFKQGDKWMNENQALELGFATEIADQVASDDADPEPEEEPEEEPEDDETRMQQEFLGQQIAQDTQQQQLDEGGGQRREPPEEPPPADAPGAPEQPTTSSEEEDMKLTKERAAKVRKALNLGDEVEITDDHLEQYFAKEEADREQEQMQQEMQETARIRAQVDEQLKPFYDAGNMSKAQLDQWTGTIMRAENPVAQMEHTVELLTNQFGDPAKQTEPPPQPTTLPSDPNAQQSRQQQTEQDDEDNETMVDPKTGVTHPIGQARKRFKQLCEEGGNTTGAYKDAYRSLKEEFGMDCVRALSTASQIKTNLEGEAEAKSFRQSIRKARTFSSLIDKKDVEEVHAPAGV